MLWTFDAVQIAFNVENNQRFFNFDVASIQLYILLRAHLDYYIVAH
jgi:hypothetical protein